MNILEIKIKTLHNNTIKINCRNKLKDEILKLQGDFEVHPRKRIQQDIRIGGAVVYNNIGSIYYIKGTGISIHNYLPDTLAIKFDSINVDNIKDRLFIKTDICEEYIDIKSFLLMLNMSYEFTKLGRLTDKIKFLELINEVNHSKIRVEYNVFSDGDRLKHIIFSELKE